MTKESRKHMSSIQELVSSRGGHLTDEKLENFVRELIDAQPSESKVGWLRQAELSLDSYVGPAQLVAAGRVKAILRQIEVDLKA